MNKTDFDTLMRAHNGRTFHSKHYPMVETVYLAVTEPEKDFIEYCGKYGITGIQRLYRFLTYVREYAYIGLNIYQIHHVIRDMEAHHDTLKEQMLEKHRAQRRTIRLLHKFAQINDLLQEEDD